MNSIEGFIESPIGKPIVASLSFIAGITVINGKTFLESPHKTVVAGVLLTGAAIIGIRIAAVVS